jgi:hypothetical protein
MDRGPNVAPTFHFSYYTLRHTNASEYLQPIDVLALMVSSVAHDLDHPGTNNAFQIATQSELATCYNDVSVLENHHCKQLYTILREERCNIFSQLPNEVQKQLRGKPTN